MLTRKALLCIFTFVACGFFVVPANVPALHGYDMVIPDQRIQLSESGSATGKWEARDLSIDYRYSGAPGAFSISGTVNFADSIVYNFESMPSFHADLIFADSRGRVLGMYGLLTASESGFDRWDPVKFEHRFVLPPGTASFAFSYRGDVVEGGGRRGGGSNPTHIWAYPLTKAPAVQ